MKNFLKDNSLSIVFFLLFLFTLIGQVKYLRTGGRSIQKETGKYITGTVNDITEYVQLRQQLSVTQQLLETIIEGDRDAISVYDHRLNCIMWNERSVETFGVTKSEAIGTDLFQLIPQLNEHHKTSVIHQVLEDDLFVDSEQHRFDIMDVILEISPVSNGVNEHTGLLIVARKKAR